MRAIVQLANTHLMTYYAKINQVAFLTGFPIKLTNSRAIMHVE
jgi:hypothetical protein